MSRSIILEAVGSNILIVSSAYHSLVVSMVFPSFNGSQSLATLSGLMALEYAWNIRFEVQVVWWRFWKSVEVKISVVARYVGLVGQTFNVWFASRMASEIPSHPGTPDPARYASFFWCYILE
ncbi:hypothetical protein AZE42_13177 [Rhizopogon vesiculosus]|uniref:Uncharacterized protein n=1 Tax=Rhizopogon vesiculosus TaxID=180088 RepID=A0A1J8PUV6_9AGAM|nr:hypothetical protein AZE42_13177 [Rhizopogon vesiculosus]